MRDLISRAQLPMRVGKWSEETSKRLAELLLEGNPLAKAIILLRIEYGLMDDQEITRHVYRAGGIYPFIFEQVPTVTRQDALRMQELYRQHGSITSRQVARKDRVRAALSALAAVDIYDEEVEQRLERLLSFIRTGEGVVPHTFVMRGMSLLKEALHTEHAGMLVPCLTIRTEAPKGRDTTPKRKENHALFVARLMREIVGLRLNPRSELGGLLAGCGFQKVILQVMEYQDGQFNRSKSSELGFVAVESALLDVLLRLE
jgi:hypothetical protein